ncbi:exportin-4-like [Phlebotomus argentipes]|uniref:exportin-4-like n=1 Tax=Phlebotomus argentipes TaxID=94469 RepID=UPI00289327B1|nr:exportin-4-like [Phlebotomus argentipes]
MDAGMLKELETAAQLVMDPQLGTQEQRKAAEALIMNFRKMKNPYEMCRHILETSTVDLVLFEAADLLKTALVYEWEFLQEQDRAAMRQYLFNYVMSREMKPFVRERILLVVAIMIKRTSIADFGAERTAILAEFQQIFTEGDAKQQYLVCRMLMAMMQEYMTTIKSDDSGLTFEDHFRAKKQFENTSLQKVFLVILKALEKLNENFDGGSGVQVLCLEFLSIMEIILSWGYITASPIFSKRLIGLFEMAFKIEQTPSLRLNLQWEETMLEPSVVKLFFDIYWKCRSCQDLQGKAANCLVQLATLNGPIMGKKENKVKYVINYFTNYLQLMSSIELKREECIPLTAICRKVLFYNHKPGLEEFPQDLVAAVLQRMFQLTCTVAERTVQEDLMACEEGDAVYAEGFTNLLEAWLTILHGKESLPNGVLTPYLMEIFNKYLQCHLSPPDGVRPLVEADFSEVYEHDTPDREKYREQLIIIGTFGREFPQHSLPVLAKLLEAKVHMLREQLQQMHSNMANVDATRLSPVFEDLHWLLLITGYVLCTEAEGEQSLIPSEIMAHSIQQVTTGGADITTSLKVLASPASSIFEIPTAEQTADHVIRIVAAVLRYCEIEQSAIEAKMTHLLSPEVSASTVWFLRFWANSYLLPQPECYANMSESLKAAFGLNTPGGEWTMNYLLKKIYVNVQSFTGELGVIDDSIKLLVSLVRRNHKCEVAFKAEYFKSVLELKNLPLPVQIKSGLLMSLIVTASCIQEKPLREQYLRELIQPICARFAEITTAETKNNPLFVQKILYSLNEVKACFEGGAMATMPFVFESFEPVLTALVNLLDYLHNSVQVVEIVLELLCKVVQATFFLNPEDTQKIYEVCMGVLQVYVKHNSNRFSLDVTSDEDNLQDLLLLLKLMNYLLSKNFFELTDSANTIDSSEFVIYGLTFLMPMITTDLLKYPNFCMQFYQTIRFFVETKSHKVCTLHPDLLTKLMASIEMGLTSFGSEVQSYCLDFLQILANTVYFDQNPESFMYTALMPFLKLLLDLILTQQVDSVNKTECSKALFSLICCYKEKFVELVSSILQSQTNPVHAGKLSAEFRELTNNVDLVNNRFSQFRFTERFDKFLVNIGFMYSN